MPGMSKLKILVRDKDRGFTLVELVVTLVLLSLVVFVSVGILSSALTAGSDLEGRLNDQIALRQATLAVTRDIRENPDEEGTLGPLDERYSVEHGMLVRSAEEWDELGLRGSALAVDIGSFSIDTTTDPGRAIITIESVRGQIVETRIFLRVF